MKTAKEILSKRDFFYSTNFFKTGERSYRESDVIIAMEEFAEQLRAELEAVRAERDELREVNASLHCLLKNS
jgi:hypothetical protein